MQVSFSNNLLTYLLTFGHVMVLGVRFWFWIGLGLNYSITLKTIQARALLKQKDVLFIASLFNSWKAAKYCLLHRRTLYDELKLNVPLWTPHPIKSGAWWHFVLDLTVRDVSNLKLIIITLCSLVTLLCCIIENTHSCRPFVHTQSCLLIRSKHTGWPKKSKPLPNFQKIVSNRIKDFQWD